MMRALAYMRDEIALVPYEQRSENVKTYMRWMMFEITFRVAIMLSLMIYLTIRKCFRERFTVVAKVELQLRYEKKYPNMRIAGMEVQDSLYCNRLMIQQFCVDWVSFFLFASICTIEKLFGHSSDKINTYEISAMVIALTQGIPSCLVIFLKERVCPREMHQKLCILYVILVCIVGPLAALTLHFLVYNGTLTYLPDQMIQVWFFTLTCILSAFNSYFLTAGLLKKILGFDTVVEQNPMPSNQEQLLD